jgi:hypothetical protein
LKDSEPLALPSPTEEEGIVKFLGDSFAYCATVMPSLAEEQISKSHNSPDGRLPGREFCWPCMSTPRIIVRKRKSVGE